MGVCFSKSAVRAFSAVSSFCISSSAVERVSLHSSNRLLSRITGLHDLIRSSLTSPEIPQDCLDHMLLCKS